jgi:transposase
MKTFEGPPSLERHEAEDGRKKLREEHIEWMRQVRSQGATIRWAAQQLGISIPTAYRALRPKEDA